ncbi:MAG TPA: metal-dependent hydrolase [Steroidobacteraceae bacterium]|nr:metal-dependent hydrolase [Steroidobacteraceae bacterium]
MFTTTPADLTITPRDLKIDRAANNGRWWHGGDPIATAFFNALSASFPQGETFFIETVRRYRDQTSGVLREQIDAFIKQEALHTREHVAFNKLIKSAGYDTSTMDAETRRRIDKARSRDPLVQLAITVALEHFTAIMAHALLTDAKPMPGAPEEVLRMWQWHAIEEIEHKAVAFDTFMTMTKKLKPLTRWKLRNYTMALITLQFWHSNFQRMADFFRQDKMNSIVTWLKVIYYLTVKPGMLRRTFLPYLSYYRPTFHPWNHDDRKLIAAIESKLALAASAT